jgi:hypothetical protein
MHIIIECQPTLDSPGVGENKKLCTEDSLLYLSKPVVCKAGKEGVIMVLLIIITGNTCNRRVTVVVALYNTSIYFLVVLFTLRTSSESIA